VADRLLSLREMTLSHPERWDAGVKFFKRISVISSLVQFELEWPNSAGGDGECVGVSSGTLPSQSGGAPALRNFGVPFYLCTHPLTQHFQIWRGNTCGEELVFRSQSHPVVKVRGPGGLSPPAPIWAPATVWAPLIESIKCYFMPK